MSYHFSFYAPSKAYALANAHAVLDKTTEEQPIHGKDLPATKAAVASYIALLPEPEEGQSVLVTVSGSIGSVDDEVSHLNVSIYAGICHSHQHA